MTAAGSVGGAEPRRAGFAFPPEFAAAHGAIAAKLDFR